MNEDALPEVTNEFTDDNGVVRTFQSGATRDTAEDKPQHWRYSSALVEKRYGEYMRKHQYASDGSRREGDNWKKGIPLDAYFDSLSRHVNDLRLHMEEFRHEATEEDLQEVLCAVKFNVDGMLDTIIRAVLLLDDAPWGGRR